MALVVYEPTVLAKLHESKKCIYIGGRVGRSFDIIQGGRGTGGILWPAGELLAQYLVTSDTWYTSLAFPEEHVEKWSWDSKNVLELGAGAGLLSCTLLCAGSIVVATDGESTVVNQIEDNISANVDVSAWCALTYQWGQSIEPLLNSLDRIAACPKSEFDVIVASDVVYGDDSVVWYKLLETLVLVSQRQSHTPLVIISQTERYKSLESQFFNSLQAHFELLHSVNISGRSACSTDESLISRSMLYVFKYKSHCN